MSVLFTTTEIAALGRPFVAQATFAMLDLPAGLTRLHNGVGAVTIGGYDWRGVSDPIGGRLVGISGLEEVAFGAAAAVTLTLTGADRAFLQSVHATARAIEGRAASLYWAAFDVETQQPITGLIPLFTRGRMTSPAIQWTGLGVRQVSLTIENLWQSQNFASGRRWDPVGQHLAYPGDKGLDFVGVDVDEAWS